MTDQTLDVLQRALKQADRVIESIGRDRLSLPTPCPGWDVRTLLEHLIGRSMRNFVLSTKGEQVDWMAPGDEVQGDWLNAYRQRSGDLLTAWHEAQREGGLDRMVISPGIGETRLKAKAGQQVAELAVHTWDLAMATRQSVELDPAPAEYALQFSQRMLRPEMRGDGKSFGTEVPLPENAPIYDRLVAWFGRDPNWVVASLEKKP